MKSFLAMDTTWGAARAHCDKRRARGEHRPCIADTILDDPKQAGKMTDGQINHFLGVLVEGGADTTSSAILTMIACLARNPEHQDIAQKELDEVCGMERYIL
jgi:cytochrome P450